MKFDYTNLNVSKYRQAREEHRKYLAKEKLKAVAQQKIKTTMIGAISSIENHFGFLIEDHEELREIFTKIRSEILGKGNNQIRNFETELQNYEVTYNRPMITLPVKGSGNEEDNR